MTVSRLRAGMPSPTGAGVRVRRSIWASLSSGASEADLESVGFAEPAFAVGFGDAGGEVVADLSDAVPLGGVGPVNCRFVYISVD